MNVFQCPDRNHVLILSSPMDLSPTHFISDIRHQHRDSPLESIRLFECTLRTLSFH